MRWLHKILGTACVPPFLLWLISGEVVIFCSSLHLGDKDLPLQGTLAAPAVLPSEVTLQAKLQPDEELTALALTTHCGEPVWRVETSEGGHLWHADSLLTTATASVPEAWYEQCASCFSPAPIVAADTIRHIDTRAPYPRAKKDLSLYRYRFDGPKRAYLYLSSQTGDAVRFCTRSGCTGVSCDTTPHMFCYWRLRQDRTVWLWVISAFASLAAIAAFTELYFGIRLHLRTWRRTKRLRSPYKRQKTLHRHLVGSVIFGLSLTLFALSGVMSLHDLPSWIVPQHETKTKRKEAQQAEAPQLGRSDIYDYHLLLDLDGVQQITQWSYGGHPYYEVQCRRQLGSQDALGEAPQPLHLTEEDIKAKFTPVLRTADTQIKLMGHYSNYYVSLNDKYELLIYRISAQDKESNCPYTSSTTGETRYYSLNEQAKEWFYPFCHNLRIGFFVEHPTLCIICMLVLVLGGLVVSVSGIVLGFRYLSRIIHRAKSRCSKSKR